MGWAAPRLATALESAAPTAHKAASAPCAHWQRSVHWANTALTPSQMAWRASAARMLYMPAGGDGRRHSRGALRAAAVARRHRHQRGNEPANGGQALIARGCRVRGGAVLGIAGVRRAISQQLSDETGKGGAVVCGRPVQQRRTGREQRRQVDSVGRENCGVEGHHLQCDACAIIRLLQLWHASC